MSFRVRKSTARGKQNELFRIEQVLLQEELVLCDCGKKNRISTKISLDYFIWQIACNRSASTGSHLDYPPHAVKSLDSLTTCTHL
jgi:hypothetical protein